jgi:acetylglutamate kinase
MKKLFITKIGGNVIDHPEELRKFVADFAAQPGLKILVHGGGKIASELAHKLGISQALVNGRRITDAETLKVTTMVYAGLLNKQIVALLQASGSNALGLSGADLNCIRTQKRQVEDIDFGFVGDMTEGSVDAGLLATFVDAGIIPVLCSVTHDGRGQLLNTNADTIASALAVSLSDRYEVQLNYCFEKKGVLMDVNNEGSLITRMNKTTYRKLVGEGVIAKGMIPKLDNSFDAITKGVKKVIIGHSADLSKMMTPHENPGTVLVG